MIVVGVVVVIAAIVLAKYVTDRRGARRGEAWAGVVVSKDRSSPDGQNMYHYIEVRLADSTTKKVQINGSLWETLNEGDSVQKQAGSYEPTKVQ